MFFRPKEDRDGGWGGVLLGLQEPQSILCCFFRGKRIYTFRGFFRGCRRMLFDCGRASSPRDDQCRHLMKAPNGL